MLYCNGTTTVIGPIVECNNNFKVALLTVPHRPAFPLEFLFIAQWQKAEVRAYYFGVWNQTPREMLQTFLQRLIKRQTWLEQELDQRLFERDQLLLVGFDQTLPRIYNMVLTEIKTLQKTITDCKSEFMKKKRPFLKIGILRMEDW